jgi:THO complex subunit 4
MSTGKLDQSLDDILKTRRQSTRRGRGPRRAGAGRPAATEAPVGGVHKTTKQPKQTKAVPTGPAAGSGESKIMISNLVCSRAFKLPLRQS